MNGFIKFLLILVILSTLGNLVGQVILWAPPVSDNETAGGSDSGSENKPGNDNENKPEDEVQKPIADVQISATVTPDENGQVPAGGVSINGVTASATVPEGVQLEDGTTELTLTVNGLEESAADLDLSENEVSTSLDVHMAGVSTDNAIPMEIKLLAAAVKGLNSTSIKLYHVENGETVEMTYVPTSEEFTAHNQFKYDPATGDVTLYIAGFSEIAMISNTVNAWEGDFDYTWYDASKTELTIANADQLAAFGAIVGGMKKVTGIGENGYTYSEEIIQDSFEGKTVKLVADVNLGDKESENNTKIIFHPIGYWNNEGTYERKPLEERTTAVSSGFYTFEGVFDGNGHTIANFYQNTWEIKGDHNWYSAITEQYFRDGMGLFGKIYGGTVKNLTIENFSSDGEIATTGVIAAYADCGATFENISIFNCNPRVYNIGNGGIVGCVGWYAKEEGLKTTFTNITVDNTNKISALWGSYDVACGGILGQYYPTSGQSSANYPVNGGIEFTNCHVSAVMDVYNDVCANYQYYAYRYTGMLIGSVRENVTGDDGRSYPKMDGITASGCTVHYGDWNDYYYCELVANSLASYTHDHQMSRLTQVTSVDVNNKKVVTLEGKTVDIPTSGRVNYVVVKAKDANGKWIHGDGHDYAECYHFVNGVQHFHDVADTDNPNPTETVNGLEGVLKEDKQLIYREFNNLVTGYGWGVTSKGVGDLAGVTILDRGNADSHNKFDYIGENSIQNEFTFTLGDLFKAATILDSKLQIKSENVQVNVSPVNGSSVSATYDANTTDWTQGTITFSGEGAATITITDYYFCLATSVDITITAREDAKKFDLVFKNTEKYLYRVGNSGTFEISKLFAAIDGADIQNDKVEVSITAVNETGASGTYTTSATSWTKGSIQFSGTGVVKVTITDNHYCTPTELYLEVVDAVNATGATSATANNVVLLNDCTFSTITVSGGYYLYGNGFTMTAKNDVRDNSMASAFVTLTNGTLDNVQIVVPNFSHAVLYHSNISETANQHSYDSNTQKYGNVSSAVMTSGNCEIHNSYISGGRAAVYVTTGATLLIDNSTIVGGAAANIHVVAAANSLTLRDVTLIQEPIQATVHDTSKTLMGLSVLLFTDDDKYGAMLNLEGYLNQYAWAHEGYKSYVPSEGQSFVTTVLKETEYIHQIEYQDGTHDSLNLGFAFLPTGTTAPADPTGHMNDQRTDGKEYGSVNINGSAYVYSYKNNNGTSESVTTKPVYSPDTQDAVLPTVIYGAIADGVTFATKYDTTKGWMSTVTVDVDTTGAYSFSFDDLLVQKYGKDLAYTVAKADGTSVDKNTTVTLNDSSTTEYILTITDDQIYDQNGNKVEGATVTRTYSFMLLSTKTSLPAPEWVSTTLEGSPLKMSSSSSSTDWNVALPVLDGLIVKYYSKAQGETVELELKDITFTTGKLADTNVLEYTVENEYTLKVTTTGFHEGKSDNGLPTYAGNTLYFTASSTDSLVGSGTTSRSVTINYEFTDANNSETLTHKYTWTVNYSDVKSAQNHNIEKLLEGEVSTEFCITPDTLITLADGTQVRVDSLKGDEMLLVWNMETGKLDAAPIMFVDSEDEAEYEIIHLYFSDGTDVKVISEHGFWDYDLNKYVYLDRYADKYIGHTFAKQNGDSLEKVELVDVVLETEVTTAWSPVTVGHLCYFVNGMLSMPGGVGGLFNIFEVDPETMSYDLEALERDIETYGLYTYEELNAICPLTEEMFNAAGGAYLKISIGKGNLTEQELINMINRYSKYI